MPDLSYRYWPEIIWRPDEGKRENMAVAAIASLENQSKLRKAAKGIVMQTLRLYGSYF